MDGSEDGLVNIEKLPDDEMPKDAFDDDNGFHLDSDDEEEDDSDGYVEVLREGNESENDTSSNSESDS